jgi:hypothetical protein
LKLSISISLFLCRDSSFSNFIFIFSCLSLLILSGITNILFTKGIKYLYFPGT